MSSTGDAFGVCPAGEETETFHERILDGLLDALSELESRHKEILALPSDRRGADEEAFLALFEKAREGVERLQNVEMPYDRKYLLAGEIREHLIDLELM